MDFKISKPTLSDIPAMRNLVLPEVQKGIILDRTEDEMAGVIRSYSVIRVVDSASDNSVLGMQFRTCENFQASTDSSLVESPKIFTNTKATPQSLPLRFCESQNLGENDAKVAESALDSAPQDEFGSPSKNPIIAFAALQILSLTLGEVRSLIVDEKYRRNGLATMLIEHLLAEARALNLKEVLALTYQREVFEKLGFKEIAKESLPNQKIWADCIKCKKFPVCDEIALTKIL